MSEKIDKVQFYEFHVGLGHNVVERTAPAIAISDETDGNGAYLVIKTKELYCPECDRSSESYIPTVPTKRVVITTG